MTYLTLSQIHHELEKSQAQLQHRQILEQAHPHFGALVSVDSALPEAQITAGFVTNTIFLALIRKMLSDETPGMIQIDFAEIGRAESAAQSLQGLSRESGLFDLVSVNPDSAPDTGFMLQHLCGAIELVRDQATPLLQEMLSPILGKIETAVRRAVPPMCSGGFHTPNHRWVMVAALAQAITLFPDLDSNGYVTAVIKSYLAEGFDIDEEGTFIERSVGVYDAVNTRSLLLIAENWPDEEVRKSALDAVRRNLDFDFHLLHADGSAETGLSRRQDYGTRNVAVGLIPTLLLYNRAVPSPDCIAMVHHLWQNSHSAAGHLTWITYGFLRSGELLPPSTQSTALLPTDFARHYPHNGIWRVRRGLLSASAFEGVTRLFGLTFGDAELTSIKIASTYFGGASGHFVSDSLTMTDDGSALLRSSGQGRPRRPGYELPLNRPVPPDQWNSSLADRSLRAIPPIVGELTINEIDDSTESDSGFELHYRTTDGLDRITCQIALDFPVGAIWETSDTQLKPVAGQVIFLKQGWGQMRFNNDVIRIDLGNSSEMAAHNTWTMREAETAPNHVRILLTMVTPADFQWRIFAYRGLG